jgi:isopenicillin-N epimerase
LVSVAAARANDVRELWGLDYTRLHVNHGSYGAAPLEVLAEQVRWRARMEAGTTYFMADELPAALRAAAARLAGYVGAPGDDLAFVDNATAGINAVLGSLRLNAGDEIVVHSHTYGAVLKTARHIAARHGAAIAVADLPFPNPTEDGIVAAFRTALTPRTRVVILDHITSASALVLPVGRLVALCREAGVLSIVDGAHAPGHVPLDLGSIGADIYVGNCHKWLMAPKGAAFLHARPEHHHWLHPTIISHGYEQGFLAEFDWTGTRDFSAALSVPAAIAAHASLGGPLLMDSNRRLAWQAAQLLAAAWDTSIPADRSLFAAMTLIGAPFAGEVDERRVLALRARLRECGADAPITAVGGRLFVRISAQAYNRIEDYEQLGDIVLRVAREM